MTDNKWTVASLQYPIYISKEHAESYLQDDHFNIPRLTVKERQEKQSELFIQRKGIERAERMANKFIGCMIIWFWTLVISGIVLAIIGMFTGCSTTKPPEPFPPVQTDSLPSQPLCGMGFDCQLDQIGIVTLEDKGVLNGR